MSKLPPALAGWEEQLRLFPEAVALSLGPWLPRLALALGPLRSRASAGDADPDGYDGLSRRGSYERLLVSEWLFALEVPDEFVRRAAMGEHGFLQLARRSPAGSRRSIALFDAGPAQLGTPRIAHLAALLVLSRRAAEAGAEFSWGILQRPALPAIGEVTPASVLRLLGGRCAEEVSDAQLAQWRRTIGPAAGDDLWLVGAGRLARHPAAAGVSLVALEDVLSPGVREVAVEISSGVGRRRVVLGLPPPDDCVRLLRDPFAVTVTKPANNAPGADAGGGLLFTPTGRRLAFREVGGALVFHPIPSSPRQPLGPPRRIAPGRGRWLIAAGWHQQRPLAVESDGAQLWLHGRTKQAGRPIRLLRIPGPFAHPPPRAALLPVILAGHALASGPNVFLPDAEGRLFGVGPDDTVMPVAARVLALSGHGGGDGVALVEEPESRPVHRLITLALRGTLPRELGQDRITAAHFGHGGGRGEPPFGFLATRDGHDRWSVHLRGSVAQREAAGRTVFGVVRDLHADGMPAILALSSDRRCLELLATGGASRRLPDASAPISNARASAVTPHLAWITESGEVVVYSLERDTVVLRLVSGAPP